MAKIPRKTAFPFGANASAAAKGIQQFGSSVGGTPNYTKDLSQIQTLAAWQGGWDPALVGGLPLQEDMNAVDFVHSQQIAYLLQQGIPEYDAATTYFTNGFCSHNGVIYISLADNNMGNTPGSAPSWWLIFLQGVPTYWGGSDSSVTAGTFRVTGVTGFPANADLLPGTILQFIAANDNPAGATLTVNSQANISIYDTDQQQLSPGMIRAGQIVTLQYMGIGPLSQPAWILVNARRKVQQWSLTADVSSADFAVTGLKQGVFVLSGTGAGMNGTQTLTTQSAPTVSLQTDTTSGHNAIFTPVNLCFPVYRTMKMFIKCLSLNASNDAQGFIGYASAAPNLGATDPLAGLTGWGIWFKWAAAPAVNAYLVNNDGSGSSQISAGTLITLAGATVKELFMDLNLDAGVVTASVINPSAAFNNILTSAIQVPPVGVTNVMVVKPYLMVQTNHSTLAQLNVEEVVGTYGL
jgi:hypothetical protein